MEVAVRATGVFYFRLNRSLHSVHQVLGLSGSQPKRQSCTTLTLGRSAASERDAVDLAVPRSPRIKHAADAGVYGIQNESASHALLSYNGCEGKNRWHLCDSEA
jgi:hypothetical protein